MLVVGLVSVIEEGYCFLVQVQDQLRVEIICDKKVEKIMVDMKVVNVIIIVQYILMVNVVSDFVKYVIFVVFVYVVVLCSSELLVGVYVLVLDINKLSVFIKGNGGVFVLQVYVKDKLNEIFDV